eukprot:4264725-Amphidinium_carterae.1
MANRLCVAYQTTRIKGRYDPDSGLETLLHDLNRQIVGLCMHRHTARASSTSSCYNTALAWFRACRCYPS